MNKKGLTVYQGGGPDSKRQQKAWSALLIFVPGSWLIQHHSTPSYSFGICMKVPRN
jgi:hypothetical protein